MIEKFATSCGKIQSEFFALNRTSKSVLLVLLVIPKFAPEFKGELRRTSELEH